MLMEWFRRGGKIDVVGERSENVLSSVSVLEKVDEIRMQMERLAFAEREGWTESSSSSRGNTEQVGKDPRL